jgi:L-asparaginase / beta-aspartyl-peptidase
MLKCGAPFILRFSYLSTIKTDTMKLFVLLYSTGVLLLLNSCQENNQEPGTLAQDSLAENVEQPIAIVLHGGAGAMKKEFMSDSLEEVYLFVLDSAINLGYTLLENGSPSIDAVTAVITILEDSPLFNAGRGAVFTNTEENELDASIMDGSTLNAGAVAGVKRIKNPILLAKSVMLNSEHVMMAGEGAENFALSQGVELIDPSYFRVESRLKSLKKVQEFESEKLNAHYDDLIKDSKFGTVGCVALDKTGNIVAGTSTGGMTNKKFGRIGDAPIIGAGTYANNKTCGVSSTGWGEFFIRSVVAYDISALMEYKGLSLADAAKLVIHEKVPALGGDGGIIALDANGNIAMEYNTDGMFRASINSNGAKEVKIFD